MQLQGNGMAPVRNPRRGAALVLGLTVVLCVAILAGSFSRFASVMTRSALQALDRKRAFYVAEAGLSEAYVALLQARSGNVGTSEEPARFGDGLFWVEAAELEPGIVELVSTARVAGGQAELSLVIEKGEQSLASLGLYADAEMALLPGSFVDGYDSSVGPYDDPAQVHTTGVVGSNTDVSVEGSAERPTRVLGDVTPGPGRAVSVLGEGVTITGSLAAALDTVSLPPVRTPQVGLAPGRAHGSAVPLVIPPGTTGAEFLTVGPDAEVTVQGPATLVLGSLALEPGAELTFDTTGGAIELYVLEGLDLAPESQIVTTSADPSRVTVQVAGETASPVRLAASGAFHGVIYAPAARVELARGFELFGALVGEELALSPGVRLHFDEHLAALAAELALPTQLSWEVLDLSSDARNLGGDPFVLLGVDPDTLPSPAEAHEDQWLELRYVDGSGTVRSYAGPESGFDWNDVDEVLLGTRDGEAFRLPGDARSGNTQDPAAADTNPDADLAAINDPDTSSGELRDRLLAAAPLSPETIEAVIDREPPLASADLHTVLAASAPLTAETLESVIHRADLDDADLAALLVAASPLGADLMSSLLARDPPLEGVELDAVLAAQ